jgi:hypothetical protein
MRPQGVSTAGQKKGIFGESWRKRGSGIAPRGPFAWNFFTKSPGYYGAGVSRADRCYEPSGEKSAVATSDPGTPSNASRKTKDHDFVIDACWRNKLKDRPN